MGQRLNAAKPAVLSASRDRTESTAMPRRTTMDPAYISVDPSAPHNNPLFEVCQTCDSFFRYHASQCVNGRSRIWRLCKKHRWSSLHPLLVARRSLGHCHPHLAHLDDLTLNHRSRLSAEEVARLLFWTSQGVIARFNTLPSCLSCYFCECMFEHKTTRQRKENEQSQRNNTKLPTQRYRDMAAWRSGVALVGWNVGGSKRRRCCIKRIISGSSSVSTNPLPSCRGKLKPSSTSSASVSSSTPRASVALMSNDTGGLLSRRPALWMVGIVDATITCRGDDAVASDEVATEALRDSPGLRSAPR
jgi:hypothetical protein